MKKLFVLISLSFFSLMFISCDQASTENLTNQTTYNSTTAIETATTFSLFEMSKYHSIAITSESEIYGWGNNQYGQLGESSNLGDEINNLTHYFNLSANENIIDIALGDFHSSILTSDGRLFIWGLNDNGQIGDGTTRARYIPFDASQYHNLNEGEKIVEINSGAGHMLSLTSEGRVFSWGYNEYGQIGIGTTSEAHTSPVDITTFFQLDSNEHVIKISSGYHHSAVLTSNGRMLFWGYNELGQLGNGLTNNLYNPTDHTQYVSLREDETIIDIEIGYYHSSLLTSENRVFVWGLGEHGQLGTGSNRNQFLPVDITSQFDLDDGDYIAKLSFGGWSSSAISQKGKIFMWGVNGQGRLGLPLPQNYNTPTDISYIFDLFTNEVIVEIPLGAWSSSAVSSEGRLFTWGRNNTFQLGHSFNEETNYVPVEVIIESDEGIEE